MTKRQKASDRCTACCTLSKRSITERQLSTTGKNVGQVWYPSVPVTVGPTSKSIPTFATPPDHIITGLTIYYLRYPPPAPPAPFLTTRTPRTALPAHRWAGRQCGRNSFSFRTVGASRPDGECEVPVGHRAVSPADLTTDQLSRKRRVLGNNRCLSHVGSASPLKNEGKSLFSFSIR